MRVALSLLAFPALAAARSVADTTTGGWYSDLVTPKNTKLLTIALGGRSFSESVGTLRVCWSEVVSVCTQVVAGTNYFYNINGCRVMTPEGMCSNTTLGSCTLAHFQVQIFEQSWTNTLEVTSIVDVKISGSSCVTRKPRTMESFGEMENPACRDQKPAEGEQELLDAWLKAMGLNEYGDDGPTQYLGGTAGFYDGCGPYESVILLFPNLPWLLAAVDEEAECEKVEKPQIIAWMNENGLNEFGDIKGTPYKRDTPLIDEITGKTMTLCVYVRLHHDGFPWLVKKEETPYFRNQNAGDEPPNEPDAVGHETQV